MDLDPVRGTAWTQASTYLPYLGPVISELQSQLLCWQWGSNQGRAQGLRQGQQHTEGFCDSFAELSVLGPCRIMGVTLVTKKTQPLLNFTEAQEACRLVGLTLASQDQVEEARKFGFETCRWETDSQTRWELCWLCVLAQQQEICVSIQFMCFCYSYGWVKNQFVVIPRIISNPKCGKSGVGVVIWRSSLSSRHRSYCHNSSGELDMRSLHAVCCVWISIAL